MLTGLRIKKKTLKRAALAAAGVLLVVGIVVWRMPDQPPRVPFSELAARVAQDEVKSIEVDQEGYATATLVDGSKLRSRKETDVSLTESLMNLGVDPKASGITIDYTDASLTWAVIAVGIYQFLISLMMFAFFALILWKSGFLSKPYNVFEPGTGVGVRFEDVAGVAEAKEELQEVVEFLKFPDRFLAVSARVPRGVLLAGPPGIGKTLLAKAVAGEADVPFFSISASEFVEMFAGLGAYRVRKLFKDAERKAPSIVFIDEIDAIGRKRSGSMDVGGHDEHGQVLNQLLTLMDGFERNPDKPGFIVLAATNRIDVLDSALLRPGRFDRRLVLGNPDVRARSEILEVHARDKPMAADVDLKTVAKQTDGFTGAELANVVNESAILAARRQKSSITLDELTEAVDRVVAGPARRTRAISAREREVVAYHEAGHALVAHFLPNADIPFKVTIVARGESEGHTRYLPKEDRRLWTKGQFQAAIAVALSGRVAEEVVFKEATTGAGDDIEKATGIARAMVTRYGMSENLGPRMFGKHEDDQVPSQRYSERVAGEIDEAIGSLVDDAYQTAARVLAANRSELATLAEHLVSNDTADRDAIERLLSRTGVGQGGGVSLGAGRLHHHIPGEDGATE